MRPLNAAIANAGKMENRKAVDITGFLISLLLSMGIDDMHIRAYLNFCQRWKHAYAHTHARTHDARTHAYPSINYRPF